MELNSSFNDLVLTCKNLLNTFSKAHPFKSYLNQRLLEETQDKFDFGYFPEEENFHILKSLLSKNKLINSKVAYEYKYTDLSQEEPTRKVNLVPVLSKHNLIMPYKDVYGNTIGIVGRTILNHDDYNISKYKNTSFNKADHLFGLFQAKEEIINQDAVFIVEGQFDCIKAHESWQKNVVAIGSSSLSFNQLALVTRYTKNIFLLLDNDSAGNQGRDLAIKKYSKYANINNNCYIPDGFKDLDDYLSSLDPDTPPSFKFKK